MNLENKHRFVAQQYEAQQCEEVGEKDYFNTDMFRLVEDGLRHEHTQTLKENMAVTPKTYCDTYLQDSRTHFTYVFWVVLKIFILFEEMLIYIIVQSDFITMNFEESQRLSFNRSSDKEIKTFTSSALI